jgi:hypothetical protein
VVIYSHTDRWYVQPYDVRPYTTIRSNGVWAKTIHLGETYAALLVKRSYIPRRLWMFFRQWGSMFSL